MVRHRPNRTGFTLVELLMVILIIAGLVAILVPTVFAAFRRAREAQVAAELNNLATALADFKQKFGDYPPSRVLLCEGGYNAFLATGVASQPVPGVTGANGKAVSDITLGQLAQRSALYMSKFWQRADFYSPLPNTPGQFHDFNGDGIQSPPSILSGAECLVFFLGGLSAYTNGVPTGLTGFSRSPTLPFVAQNIAPNRTVPMYDFNGGRLKDLDHDGIPTYVDPFGSSPADQRPYAYFSAYGSNAYDPNDVNDNGHTEALNGNTATYSAENIEVDESTTQYAILRQFTVSFPVGTPPASVVVSSSPNPYTTSQPVNASGANYVNPTSFQLFSAGADRLWGLGGLYSPAAASGGRLPLINGAGETNLTSPDDFDSSTPTNVSSPIRDRERDNITNFSGGRLD